MSIRILPMAQTNHWPWRFSLFVGLAFALSLTVLPAASAHAATSVPFQLLATHPYASKTGYDSTSVNYYSGAKLCYTTWCPNGETINDIGITKTGQLIAGYGDWDTNVDSFGVAAGGIYVVPYDLATNTWDMMNAIRAGSEALDSIVEINGDIYAPQTDPSDKAPTGFTNGNTKGYVTNRGGTWHVVQAKDASGAPYANLEHLLNMSSIDGNDLWIFAADCLNGGCTNDRASALRSTDGGATWSLAFGDISTGSPSGFERYYWGVPINGKMYTQAIGTSPATPMRRYDKASGTVSSAPDATAICTNWHPNMAVAFDHAMVCPTGVNDGKIVIYNGTTTRTMNVSGSAGTIKDFYVARDGYLYVLLDNSIYRTASLNNSFQAIGTAMITDATFTPASIAVYNDIIYLGGSGGKLFSAPLPVPKLDHLSATEVAANGSIVTLYLYGVNLFGADVKLDGKTLPSGYDYQNNRLITWIDTSKLAHSSWIASVLGLSDSTTSLPLVLSWTDWNSQSATLAVTFASATTTPSAPATPGAGTTPSQLTAGASAAPGASRVLASTGVNLRALLWLSLVGIAVAGAGIIMSRRMFRQKASRTSRVN